MKLKKTGVVSMAIAIALINGSIEVNAAYAMKAQEQMLTMVNYHEIVPLWDEISSISPYISANGTTLYPEVYINAKSFSSSINGTMYLEKYASGRWINVTSWEIKSTGNAFLSKTYNGSSGTKYRVRVVVTVDGERAEATSGTCEI